MKLPDSPSLLIALRAHFSLRMLWLGQNDRLQSTNELESVLEIAIEASSENKSND